jgi:hypothetical protein
MDQHTQKVNAPKLLSPGELAALWSLSTKQILELCRSGRLPHIRINDRVIRISPTDAAVFYATNATRPNSTQDKIAGREPGA